MNFSELGKELVGQMLKPFVDTPEDLHITSGIDERGVLIKITVDNPNDRGRVIGRNGATISVVRDYMRLVGNKVGAYYSVKVVQDE